MLAAAERERLRRQTGDLFLALARVELDLADDDDAARGAAAFAPALDANRCAETSFPTGTPCAVWSQRAAIAKLSGDDAAEREALALAAQTPLRNAEDYRLAGTERLLNAKYAEALPLLEEATRRDPADYASWLRTGVCQMRLLRHPAAAASFSTCIALWKEQSAAWFNRGVNELRRERPSAALDDFDRVILLCPHEADPVLSRAMALMKLNRFNDAIGALNKAVALGATTPRTYFLRSKARESVQDLVGARADRAEGYRREPVDALDFVTRALYRDDEHDHQGALDDYDRALAREPHDHLALKNKAALLSQAFVRDEESARVLDHLLSEFPDDYQSRITRAVLYARLGRHDAALTDAAVTLAQPSHPVSDFRAAGVFALCSPAHPEHVDQALRLLDRALQAGFGLDLVDDDSDLDPIRTDPRFGRIVAQARAAAPLSPPTSKNAGISADSPPSSRGFEAEPNTRSSSSVIAAIH